MFQNINKKGVIHIVLIFAPIITDVKKIKIIGKIVIDNKYKRF